jgi:alpha-tubulin suppressor-like RCC1 family protein
VRANRASALTSLGVIFPALFLTGCGTAGPAPSGGGPPPPAAVIIASSVAGNDHTCALTTAGDAYCWGDNYYGQLGTGGGSSQKPNLVLGGLKFKSLAAGHYHTCGLTNAGIAYCWGRNDWGHLGDGSTINRTAPTAVLGGLTFSSLAAGFGHTCGITTSGEAYCWGRNYDGQMGNGTTSGLAPNPVPAPVLGGILFSSVSARGDHTCGIASSGPAYCWGYNHSGQVGNGAFADSVTVPEQVVGGLGFPSVSAGGYHSCGLTTTGVAYCWGGNWYAQVGIPETYGWAQPVPVQVSGGLTFSSLAAGGAFNCALAPAGATYCWGLNDVGALGSTPTGETCSTLPCSSTPLPVSGGHSFTSITAGPGHACGVTSDGELFCWGFNQSGQLGDGSYINRRTPVHVQFTK